MVHSASSRKKDKGGAQPNSPALLGGGQGAGLIKEVRSPGRTIAYPAYAGGDACAHDNLKILSNRQRWLDSICLVFLEEPCVVGEVSVDGGGEGSVVLAAAGVGMSAAAEELRRKDIHRSVAL